MPLTLDEVCTRAALSSVLHCYAQGVDQRDWPLFLSAFAADARIEVPGYSERTYTPHEFAEFLRTTFDAARISGQHALSNSWFEVRAMQARVITEFMAVNLEHTDDPRRLRRQRAGGLYIDELQCVQDEWKIVRHCIVRKNDDEEMVAATPQNLAWASILRQRCWVPAEAR